MKETDKIYPADKGEEELLHNVRHILQEARAKVIHHVNSTLVRAYWQVGKYIVEYEQQGTDRAGYGKAVINTLSRRLVAEFGNGFTATNLRYMRQFYACRHAGRATPGSGTASQSVQPMLPADRRSFLRPPRR